MTAFPARRLSIDPHGHVRRRRRMPDGPSPGARAALDSGIAALDARGRRGQPLEGAGAAPDPRQGRGVALRLDPEAGRGEAAFGPGFHHLAPALRRAGIAALLRAAHGLRSP